MSSDGLRVLEADLRAERPEYWIARAHERNAELLWLHGNADLTGKGFERFPGYVRLRAESPPAGEVGRRLAPEHFAKVQDAAFHGLWGHKLVSPDAEPPPGSIVLGLYDGSDPIGICTIFPSERLIDGPGVVSGAREPAAYVRLLLAACAELGAGPVDLDSWGDDPAVIAAYEEVGFEVVEREAGWQFRVT